MTDESREGGVPAGLDDLKGEPRCAVPVLPRIRLWQPAFEDRGAALAVLNDVWARLPKFEPVLLGRAVRRLAPYLVILAALGLQVAQPFAPFDDAFITYRYARNVASGDGFVYNAAERVLGTSTTLYAFLLAAAAVPTGPEVIPVTAHWVNLLADALAAILLFRIASRAFDNRTVAFLVAVAYVVNPFRMTVAQGGMEVSLLTLLLLASFERLILERSLWMGAGASALTVLVRLDAALLLAPFYAYLLIRDRSFGIRAATLTGLFLAPWLVWSTSYFGSPVPNSIIAKARAYTFHRGFATCFITSFLGTGVVTPCWSLPSAAVAPMTILITSSLTGIVQVIRKGSRLAPLVLAAPFAFLLLALANAPMFFPWYFYPSLPGLLLAQASSLWFIPGALLRTRLVAVGLMLLFSTLTPAYFLTTLSPWPTSRERELAFLDLCPVMRNEIGSGRTVLAPDIGIIGWCLPETEIIDPIGLVSPAAVPFLSADPDYRVISPELLAAAKPDYIVTLDQYLAPLQVRPTEFSHTYHQLWSVSLSIGGDAHTLYVFSRVE